MRTARQKRSIQSTDAPASVTAKFAKIQKSADAEPAARPAPPAALGEAARAPVRAMAVGAAAPAVSNLDKAQRIVIMEADAAAADKIAGEIEERTDSPDPVESRRARKALTDARNTRDDLKENVAFLRDQDVFKPLDAGTIQHLDELADIINARIKNAALVGATLAILAETLRSTAMIGQILDERG